MCRAFTRFEHLHWRLVGVQHAVAEYLGLQSIDQRLQPHAAGADPLRQGGAGDGQTGAAKDALLPVQRQMIGVLGHQHLGQQTGGRDTFVDHMRVDRCLLNSFALCAGPLAPDVTLHCEHAWHIVQLLCHVFADALHLAAATGRAAGGGLGLVVDLAPRQLGR